MPISLSPSGYRVEKERIDALVMLSNGESMPGYFFVAKTGTQYGGPERVGELLNAVTEFFPFEARSATGMRTVLYNRRHVVMVSLIDNEAHREPGYDVATRRVVSLLFSNGCRVSGSVRIYQPEGRDRLSDWARQGSAFRYLETSEGTLLVNIAHVIEISEDLDS